MSYTTANDAGGQWVRKGQGCSVLVWVPTPVKVGAACQDCGAMPDQSCRTRNGHRTKSHQGRTSPRVCRCGQALSWKARACHSCLTPSGRESARRDRKRAA
jgi:hypothetical protein